MYILKILRCLWLARCILICCSSVSLVVPCLLLGWIGFSRDTVDLCRIDMIGEYQPLVINTFVVKNAVPVKDQLSSHGRVVSFFVVVLYSVVSSVLYVAVEIDGENRVVTSSKWT